MDALQHRRRRLFAPGKGILGLDTRPAVLAGRLRAADVVPAAPDIRAYRSMILETPGLAANVSGVVLPPDGFGPRPDGGPVPRAVLSGAGILAGARADTGHEPLSARGRSCVTSGLDGLGARLSRLRERGADFAVWSVCTGVSSEPGTMRSLATNSHAAARFAGICQDLGMVPLIRVGTRMAAAPAERRRAALTAALLSLCGHLGDLDVDCSTVVISTWCAAGLDTDGPLDLLPSGLGGLALTTAPNSAAAGTDAGFGPMPPAARPWPVTFYLGREATGPALRTWRGRAHLAVAGQRELRARLSAASAAFDRPSRRLHLVAGDGGAPRCSPLGGDRSS